MIKKRNLFKEELDLWKEVTKHDKKLKSYLTKVDDKPFKNIKEIYINNEESRKESKKSISKKINESFQINKRMKFNLERGNIRPEAELDLHGNNQREAKRLLESFINACINKNVRCILVITGKKNTSLGAQGVLREKLPAWLTEQALANKILGHSYAINKDGADGARYILLRKKEKVFYDE